MSSHDSPQASTYPSYSPRRWHNTLAVVAWLWLLSLPQVTLRAAPPRMLIQGSGSADAGAAGGSRTSFALMRLPTGNFAFYDRNQPRGGPLSLSDRAGMVYTLLPYLPPEVLESRSIENGVLSNTQVVFTTRGDIVSVMVRAEAIEPQLQAKVGLPRYLDVWCQLADRQQTYEPQMIWRGYNGSQMEYQRVGTGRILVPFGSFQPHAKPDSPTGRHKTIIQISDDEGKTWRESPSQLVSPLLPRIQWQQRRGLRTGHRAAGRRPDLDANEDSGWILVPVLFARRGYDLEQSNRQSI